jgi:hypothetical protein
MRLASSWELLERPPVWTLRSVPAVAALVSNWAAMPISTACVKCHRPLRVKSSAAGKRVLCPRCGWDIEIPTEAAAGSVARGAASRRAAPLPPRESRAADELLEVPTLKRTKYRNPRRWSRLGLPLFKVRPGRWSTILALVFLLGMLFEYSRSPAQKPQAVAQNAAQPDQVVAAPQIDLQPAPLAGPAQNFSVEPVESPIPNRPKVQPPQLPVESSVAAAPKSATLPNVGAPKIAAAPDPSVPNQPLPNQPLPNQPLANQPGMVPFGPPMIGRGNNRARFGARPPGFGLGAARGGMRPVPRMGQPPVGMPAARQLAASGLPTMPHLGRYSKDDPPAVGDIVMVLFAGPRIIGKVTAVNARKDECKIKILDAQTFEMTGKAHETGKTRTVRLEQLLLHPRMHFAQHPAKQPTEPDSLKEEDSGE